MADMGNDFQIRVSTEALREKADSVSILLEKLRSRCEEINTRIQRTSAYWEGDGGTKRRTEYANKQKTVDSMLKRLTEYPEDLLEMAGVYEEAEAKNMEQSSPLPGDIII